MQQRIVAIVPAFNEEANIRGVIADLKQHQPNIKVAVVNDCSTDGTDCPL